MVELFVAGAVAGAFEAGAVAVGRLDAALAGNPVRRTWSLWSGLDTARRHAEADGHKVDLFRLAAPGRPRRTDDRPGRRDRRAEPRRRPAFLDGGARCRTGGPA